MALRTTAALLLMFGLLVGASSALAVTPTSLNVKAFGAIGDGKVDDTAAIQKALDAGGGKQVTIPAGTYKVRPLRLRTTTALSLDPAATLILAPGSNSDLITVTAAGASVTGGTLDGNRAFQTKGAAILVGGPAGVTIRDVRIVNTATYGIYAANLDRLDISGVSISGTGYIGIFAESTWGNVTNLVIENNHVDRSAEGASIAQGGIQVHRTGPASSVSGVRISGNTVVMPRGVRGDSAIAIETWGGVQGALIQNNTTVGGSMGVSLDHTTNAQVTGNVSTDASMYGIELAASSASTVSTNTVHCDGTTPIGVVLSNTAPTDDTVSNNTISGCTARGIELNKGSSRAVLTGNNISQGGGYGVEIIGTSGVSMTNNVVDGLGSGLKGVIIDTSSNVTVTGNRFSNFKQYDVALYAATPFVLDVIRITSNTFSGTSVPYGTLLSGGAKLGDVVFNSNTILP